MTDCRVVIDGDEEETFLYCFTCLREVCCGHHLAPHDEDGCHEQLADGLTCQCKRRVKRPAGATHTPCCSSHGVYMTCLDYRRTHFVEVGACCAAWQDDEAGQLADAERMAAITAEQEAIRKAEREISWVIEPAITTAMNGIERLIGRGTITQEQATNALASFPDFSDAWEEHIA